MSGFDLTNPVYTDSARITNYGVGASKRHSSDNGSGSYDPYPKREGNKTIYLRKSKEPYISSLRELYEYEERGEKNLKSDNKLYGYDFLKEIEKLKTKQKREVQGFEKAKEKLWTINKKDIKKIAKTGNTYDLEKSIDEICQNSKKFVESKLIEGTKSQYEHTYEDYAETKPLIVGIGQKDGSFYGHNYAVQVDCYGKGKKEELTKNTLSNDNIGVKIDWAGKKEESTKNNGIIGQTINKNRTIEKENSNKIIIKPTKNNNETIKESVVPAIKPNTVQLKPVTIAQPTNTDTNKLMEACELTGRTPNVYFDNTGKIAVKCIK